MLVIIVALQVLLVNLFGGVSGQGRDYEKDFQQFQYGGGGGRPTSYYTIYDEDDEKRARGIESPLESFGAESKITYSPYYLSPDRLIRNYRSATEKYGHNDREGSLRSYDEFFARNFGQDYQVYNNKAPLISAVENEETEHETEAPRAGPRKHKRPSSRRASYKAPKPEETEEYTPYEYNYGGSSAYKPSDEYQRIKDLSEQQAKEIEQNPQHCKTVKKEEMECHVCHDPKSGAKSESCSYASRPAAKKYAFVKEKKYNSNDDDGESGEEEEAPKARRSESLRAGRPQRRPKTENTHAALTVEPSPRQRSPRGKKSRENRPQRDVIGLDPYLYGNPDDDDEEEEEEEEEKPKKQKNTSHANLKSYEDYFSHVFPEQSGRKSKEELKDNSEYEFLPDYEHKKNVEEVLAEFKTRDWSKCKKTKKGDLTCYECKDPNGVQNEECMYVSESSPRSSRLTYEENKKYTQPEKEEEPQQVDEEDDDEDYEDTKDASPSEVVTERSAKLRLRPRKNPIASALSPEDSLDQKLPKKRTIKRKVTYRSNGNPDRLDKDESRVVYYEQKYTQTEN
ncbi:hypothetical protein DMENIID0001_015520 [Sergentomyia squamirostris]